MFFTNKRIKAPKEITMNGSKIEVLTTFKLLGVTLDNKLNFDYKSIFDNILYSFLAIMFKDVYAKLNKHRK